MTPPRVVGFSGWLARSITAKIDTPHIRGLRFSNFRLWHFSDVAFSDECPRLAPRRADADDPPQAAK